MARIEEMMRQFAINEYKIRLWIAGSMPSVGNDIRRKAFDAAFVIVNAKGLKITEGKRIADEIARIPSLNAVEVLNKDGDGDLVYPEWP